MKTAERPDIRVPLELLRIRQELLSGGSRWEVVRRCLDLVDELFCSETLVGSPLLDLGRLDHVGFMVPVDDEVKVLHLAREAGFDREVRTFPSTILAAELGTPIRILKAHGRRSCVEVFMPTGVAPQVDPHIALRVKAFDEPLRLLRDAGFYPLSDPKTNTADRVEAFYLARVGTPMRLELCRPTVG